ncbi:MAG: carboxymuconolactone decarboxylase family protein [Planctomycetota bacterium]
MNGFTLHTLETAGESKPLLEKGLKAMGFVPNLYAMMAESPALLEAYQSLSAAFGKTGFSATEQQIVLMTNNRLNGCDYCMAAHTTISRMSKVPEDVIEALRSGSPIGDSKLEALRVFVEKVNRNRGWLEDGDMEEFLAAGYTRKHVLEVILGTSLKVLSNYTNHVTGTPLDDAFSDAEWKAAELSA